MKKCLDMIENILETIADEDILGMDIDYDEDEKTMEINTEAVDIPTVLSWTGLINKALETCKVQNITYKIRGVADDDYYSYTAFEIDTCQGEIKEKECMFVMDYSEEELVGSNDDRIFKYEAAESDAFSQLRKINARTVGYEELEFDDDLFDAVISALEE